MCFNEMLPYDENFILLCENCGNFTGRIAKSPSKILLIFWFNKTYYDNGIAKATLWKKHQL